MSAENSISEDDRYLEYPAFDGQVRFSVTFKFQRDEDLEVAIVNQDGTPSILRLNVDYTVSGAGEDLGGAITLTDGAEKDVVYSIRGDAEYNLYQRLTSANYSPSTINAIFERCLIWIIEQDHNFREKLARSILLPQSLSEAELQELQENFITIGNNAEAIVSRIHESYLTESSDGHFDAAGRSIRNLPEPTQEDEAATLGWVLKRSAIAGPQGEKGPDGDQGPEGPTGPVGPQGPIGPKGPEGDQGEQGPIGIQGPQGKRGPIGPEGPAGEQGPQGMVGPQGPTGPRGPEGVQGPIGIQGPQGPQGAEGPMGESYEVDSMGLIANRAEYDTKPYMWSFLAIDEGKIYWKRSNEIAHWTDGIAFGRGPTGSQGPQGPQGVKGEKGDLGPQGEAGPQGPQGIEGPTGETGPRGPEGPEGPIGPQGVVGAQGSQGIQGVKGETGLQGPIGPSGPTGPQGPKGDRGATWRGSWSAAMAYVVNDLVEYDGSTYIALASSSNVAPTGSLGTKWSLFAEAGSASNHTHDDRYYTKSISNGRYLGKSATAANASKLGGHLPSYFATATSLDDYYNKSTSDGRYLRKGAKAADSNKLGGQLASYFAKASDIPAGFVTDVRLGTEGSVSVPISGARRLPTGYVGTGMSQSNGNVSSFYGRPVQKQVDGTWYTVSQE